MNIKIITKIGVFSAILCILSIISIPTPFGVPLTLQTFGVSLVGFILGKKYGTISVLIYIILGAIGLPVFAGLNGGFIHIIGPTGGFIIGFLFLAFFSGFNKNNIISISLSLLGLIICHILGIVQFSFVTKNPIIASFTLVSLPYLIKDILSIFFAFSLKKLLEKHLKFIDIKTYI